jgi:hypothetical protein
MSQSSSGAPKWFLIVGIIALVWNLLGVFAYIMQQTMSPADLAALYETTPAWATAAFAIAVHGGALGCLALVFKKSWALPLLVISLTAVLVQMVHAFFISNSIQVFGPGGMIMPVMILVIAVYLVFLARSAKEKGWIS